MCMTEEKGVEINKDNLITLTGVSYMAVIFHGPSSFHYLPSLDLHTIIYVHIAQAHQ